MCTVSYIPLANDGFIITQNRDELFSRLALEPKRYILNNKGVIFPKDPQSNGTWIATSDTYTLCLLNGASQKHKHLPPYRQSRGLIITHFFNFNSINDFYTQYNFQSIEPFTLLIFPHHITEDALELKWNGSEIQKRIIDLNEINCWSSVTLYNTSAHQAKENLLKTKLSMMGMNLSQNELMQLHQFQSSENNSFIYNTNGIQTTSITSVKLEMGQISVCYKDLVSLTKKNCHSFI